MSYEPNKNLIQNDEDIYRILRAIKNHESLNIYLHQSNFDPNQLLPPVPFDDPSQKFEFLKKFSFLTAAIEYKNPEAAHLLIQSGADVNLLDGYQRTPLSYAGERNDLNMTQTLLQQGASIDPNCLYYSLEHPQIVDEFLKNGANPNWIENNETMLEVAVELAPPETVQHLISAGAEINHQSESGYTALHIAAHYEKAENVQVMLKNGADITLENNRGETAWSMASPAIKQVFSDFEKQALKKVETPQVLTSVPRKRMGG